jgi:cell division protein YceG involved in septum cleavage
MKNSKKKIVQIELTEQEAAVIDSLAKQKQMSEEAILRQALRLYQSVEIRLQNGENFLFPTKLGVGCGGED